MSSPTPPPSLASLWWPGDSLVSESAFKTSMWVCTSLCIVLGGLRFSTRLLSFRRLLMEDYFIIVSLVVLIALSAELQHFLGDIYAGLRTLHDGTTPAPGTPAAGQLTTAIRAVGISCILSNVGIWAIKLNFLAFFRVFGRQIKRYMILWWISFVLVAACGVTHLGLIPYDCLFRDLGSMNECATMSGAMRVYIVYEASVAIDILSDVIIICFPVYIIWRTTINMKQKVLLTGVFLLVGFTITVTILRGSTVTGMGRRQEGPSSGAVDTEWMLFCFFIQYTVSFIIACIISFRSMWINQERKSSGRSGGQEKKRRVLRANKNSPPASGDSNARWKRIHDTLMQTIWELEGADVELDGSYLINHEPPSGRMTVDFSQWDSTLESGPKSAATTSTQHPEQH